MVYKCCVIGCPGNYVSEREVKIFHLPHKKYSEVGQRLTYPSLVSIVETNVPLNQYRQMV